MATILGPETWEFTVEGPLTPLGALYFGLLMEDRDRAEWIEGIRDRLGLVTSDGGLPRRFVAHLRDAVGCT